LGTILAHRYARIVVQKSIHEQPNRVRYTMNGFVMALGCCVAPLQKRALAAARKIGPVEVDMGGTACKIHVAAELIEKVAAAGRAGRKRKSARC
jgi:hypothetical protein